MVPSVKVIWVAMLFAACSDGSFSDAAQQSRSPSMVHNAGAPATLSPTPAAAKKNPPNAQRAAEAARVLREILAAAPIRDWEEARSLFPGVKWEPMQKSAVGPYASPDESTHNQWADTGAGFYDISGVPDIVRSIYWSIKGATSDSTAKADNREAIWSEVIALLNSQGVKLEKVGCWTDWGSGYFRLTENGQSVVFQHQYDDGGHGPSSDIFSVDFDKPFGDDVSEQDIAHGRVGFCD